MSILYRRLVPDPKHTACNLLQGIDHQGTLIITSSLQQSLQLQSALESQSSRFVILESCSTHKDHQDLKEAFESGKCGVLSHDLVFRLKALPPVFNLVLLKEPGNIRLLLDALDENACLTKAFVDGKEDKWPSRLFPLMEDYPLWKTLALASLEKDGQVLLDEQQIKEWQQKRAKRKADAREAILADPFCQIPDFALMDGYSPSFLLCCAVCGMDPQQFPLKKEGYGKLFKEDVEWLAQNGPGLVDDEMSPDEVRALRWIESQARKQKKATYRQLYWMMVFGFEREWIKMMDESSRERQTLIALQHAGELDAG